MGRSDKNKKKLTASEMRFAKEMEVIMHMSLDELMNLERNRMTIGA